MHKWVDTTMARDPILTMSIVEEMDMMHRHVESPRRRSKTNKSRKKIKVKYQIQRKVKHLNLLITLLPIVILESL